MQRHERSERNVILPRVLAALAILTIISITLFVR